MPLWATEVYGAERSIGSSEFTNAGCWVPGSGAERMAPHAHTQCQQTCPVILKPKLDSIRITSASRIAGRAGHSLRF